MTHPNLEVQERRALSPPQTNVHLHGTLGVDGETDVGVNGNTEETRVGVDKLVLVPNHRVPQDASIIEVSQTSHVFRAVKLGRIDLATLVFLEDFDLMERGRIGSFSLSVTL